MAKNAKSSAKAPRAPAATGRRGRQEFAKQHPVSRERSRDSGEDARALAEAIKQIDAVLGLIKTDSRNTASIIEHYFSGIETAVLVVSERVQQGANIRPALLIAKYNKLMDIARGAFPGDAEKYRDIDTELFSVSEVAHDRVLNEADGEQDEVMERVGRLIERMQAITPKTWEDVLALDSADIMSFVVLYEELVEEYRRLESQAKGDALLALREFFAFASGIYDSLKKKEEAEKAVVANVSAPVSGDASLKASPELPERSRASREREAEPSEDEAQELHAFLEFLKKREELKKTLSYTGDVAKDMELDNVLDKFDEEYGDARVEALARMLVAARRRGVFAPDSLLQRANSAFKNSFGKGTLFPAEYLKEKERAAAAPEKAAAASHEIKEVVPLNVEPSLVTEASDMAGQLLKGILLDAPSVEPVSSATPVEVQYVPEPPGEMSDDLLTTEKIETHKEELEKFIQRVQDLVSLLGSAAGHQASRSDAAQRNFIGRELQRGRFLPNSQLHALIANCENPQTVEQEIHNIFRELERFSFEERQGIFEEETEPGRVHKREGRPLLLKQEVRSGPSVREEEAGLPDLSPFTEPYEPGPVSVVDEKEAGFKDLPPYTEAIVEPSEPGPLPEIVSGKDAVKKAVPALERESVFARMRHWTRETAEKTYRTQLLGELTKDEQREKAPTLSRSAMFAGGALSAALSYFGFALPVDAIRYFSQRIFVKEERTELLQAFERARAQRVERVPSEREEIQEREDALEARLTASRYLTENQKKDLLAEIRAQEDTFVQSTTPQKEHLTREVGRILEGAVRTRISEEKVLKEAVNSLFALTGVQFLRAPAYGAISLWERYNRLTRETPESKAGDRLQATVSEGFGDWWEKANGKKGRLAQAAAVGTAFRFVGMGKTFVDSDGFQGIVGDLLSAWQKREAAYPDHLPDFGKAIDDLVHDVREQVHRLLPAQEHIETPVTPARIEVPQSPAVDVPSVDINVAMAPSDIPVEAVVEKGGGITQTLLAGIEARGELLHDAERAALRDDYAAALLMRRLAAKEGLLDYWINDKAVGELAVVPTYDAQGDIHITFLNPDNGNAYSIQELRDLGWLTRAPK